MKDDDLNITRLKGELRVENGRYRLLVENKSNSTHIDSDTLSTALQKLGIKTTLEQTTSVASSNTFVLHLHEPSNGLVEVQPTRTLISSSDKVLASRIFEAVDSLMSDNQRLSSL